MTKNNKCIHKSLKIKLPHLLFSVEQDLIYQEGAHFGIFFWRTKFNYWENLYFLR